MSALQQRNEPPVPGQANNVCIFPGAGLGVPGSMSRSVTERIFLAAANSLSAMITGEGLACGRVFPALKNIREVALKIAAAPAEIAHREQLAQIPSPENLEQALPACMFRPIH